MDRAELLQLINLSEELVPAGQHNRPGTRIAPKFVTIHNTSNANPGADAKAHSRFVRNTGFYMINGKQNWVSWHYTVDDKVALRHVPPTEKAYHAGPANSVSIAMEVCMHQGIDRAAADLRAARLAALLLFDFGLGIAGLRTHQSWTGKNCPQLLIPRWAAFVQQVEGIRRTITSAGFVAMESLSESEEAALAVEAAGYDDAEIDQAAMAEAMRAEEK